MQLGRQFNIIKMQLDASSSPVLNNTVTLRRTNPNNGKPEEYIVNAVYKYPMPMKGSENFPGVALQPTRYEKSVMIESTRDGKHSRTGDDSKVEKILSILRKDINPADIVDPDINDALQKILK